ncbi:MAG: hypothetical protein QNJ18_07665 [Xenococcaceae cyanobacterium MO_167.B52]|nr:hypothetical protein [Xenococcaceae cyanobacterium MO_167.B52]
MAWRGSTDIKDRIFGALVYSVPLSIAFSFSLFVRDYIPQVLMVVINIFLIPYSIIRNIIPFGDIVIFFALFLLVVRNERIKHFIRFNTMQSLLLDIALTLLAMGMRILGSNLITAVLSSVIFMMTLIVCIYSIIQCALGKYPDIPGISQAVYTQVP